MQESAEDHDTEAALDGNGIGDEEATRVEDTESQEAAGPAVGVEETAPSRPEENEKEAKKSAPEKGEREAASAPVE